MKLKKNSHAYVDNVDRTLLVSIYDYEAKASLLEDLDTGNDTALKEDDTLFVIICCLYDL